MKSIFDKRTREEIVNRIDSLTELSKGCWSNMTVAQMVKHCAICEEYYFGNIQIKRSFIGRIFGNVAIKRILSYGEPIEK